MGARRVAGGSLRVLWESFRYCRTPRERAGRIASVIAAARLCVVPMTFYSVAIGGALAWAVEGVFSWPVFLVVLAGFTLAHLADNLLNDLFDYKHGLDSPDYFRALYGPHPIIDGILTPSLAARLVAGILAVDAAIALVLALKVSLLIPLLALAGALVMASYAGLLLDAKRLGLGELLVAVVWGPVMAGGTILALTGSFHPELAPAYLAYALAVSLVLVGKHLDKLPHDRARGVGTLPVRLGERRARRLAALLALALPPLASAGLIATLGWTPTALLPLASLPVALAAAVALSRGRPETPPRRWRVWPLWYVAHAYAVMDSIGRTTLLSIILAGLALHRGAGPWLVAVALLVAAWEALVARRLALALYR